MLQKSKKRIFNINFAMGNIFDKKLFANIESEEITNYI